MNKTTNIVDDQGTTQADARKLLNNFCRQGFDNKLNEAALALGRPKDELENFLNGNEEIDDDLMMKIRGIAGQRNIEL